MAKLIRFIEMCKKNFCLYYTNHGAFSKLILLFINWLFMLKKFVALISYHEGAYWDTTCAIMFYNIWGFCFKNLPLKK